LSQGSGGERAGGEAAGGGLPVPAAPPARPARRGLARLLPFGARGLAAPKPPAAGFSLTKRLVLVTAIAFVPALLILVHYELDLRRARDAEIRALALRTARQTHSEIERIFEGVENLLRTVAHGLSVMQPEGPACSGYLWSLQRRVPHLSPLAVLDIKGEIACPTYAPRDEQRYATKSFFRDVLGGKRFAVGPLSTLGASEARVLPVAVPYTQQNQFSGAVIAGLEIGWLRERLKERGFDGADVMVADREGRILLYEPSDGGLFGQEMPEEYRRLLRAEAPGTLEVAGPDGARRIMGYLPASAPEGIFVSASVPLEAAFAPLDEATGKGLAFALLGLLVALTAAWAVGRFLIERPVRRLQRTLRAWRKGDDAVRTGMDPAKGEIEALGAAVDRLLNEVGTRQREASEAARGRLESEERYRSLIELSPDAQFVDVDTVIVFVNAAMLRLLGAESEDEIVGRSSLDLIAEEFREEVRRRIASLREPGAPPNRPMEQRWRRLDGSFVEVEVVSARVPWEGGNANQVILRDIAARKAAEERQDLLLHELNHRVKNTLATVQSLASQTLRNAGSLKDFGQKFSARLLALSSAHGLLTQGQWEHAPLAELLRNELAPYGDERFSISGEDIQLPPRIVLPLGMVFHELATNAAKHGALSAPGGRVHVEWRVDERRFLRLAWREEGGPPAQKPAAEGFGSRLLDRTVSGELAGRYERRFRASGLVCRIAVPLPGADPAELKQRAAA
jgi:PAS domain S-box-containing protein